MSGDVGRSEWASPLLRDLPEEDLRELLAACRVVGVEPGQQLARADEDRVVLIAEGAAKAHATTLAGDEVITAILGPGDPWGFGVALGYRRGGTDLAALQPIAALVLSGRDLRRLVRTRPPVAAACLRTVGRQLALSEAETLTFAGTSTVERVTLRVLQLATRWGEASGEGVVVTLPLSQVELAAWAASSRESTAKVLQTLRRTGIVRTGRRSLVVLDVERLRERCSHYLACPIEDLAGGVATPGAPTGLLAVQLAR